MNFSPHDLNDNDIKEVVKVKYEHHLRLSNRYKSILDTLEEDMGISTGAAKPSVKEVDAKSASNISPKQTFEEIIVDILKQRDMPQQAKYLIDEYTKRTGKSTSVKDFSSKLSMRAKNGKIKNVEFKELPIGKRFWWGLSEWYEGDNFKLKYISKLSEVYPELRQESFGFPANN